MPNSHGTDASAPRQDRAFTVYGVRNCPRGHRARVRLMRMTAAAVAVEIEMPRFQGRTEIWRYPRASVDAVATVAPMHGLLGQTANDATL